MSLEYDTLLHLRQSHPAWRLLCAANAPLIASFLERVFVLPNVRVISQGELAEALEDELFARRQTEGEKAYTCLLYTSPSPRDGLLSRMPSSA